MSTTTLTKAAAARLTQSISPGLPPLPFPIDWSACVDQINSIFLEILPERLTPEQQEANLLHVALWIVERGIKTFDMEHWHVRLDILPGFPLFTTNFEQANHCNTVHCIAGFAQVMSGPAAFNFSPATVGRLTLGAEAYAYFRQSNETALGYLRDVIARNS